MASRGIDGGLLVVVAATVLVIDDGCWSSTCSSGLRGEMQEKVYTC